MATHVVTVEVEVRIDAAEPAEARIQEMLGLSPEDARAFGVRPGLEIEDILLGLACSLIYAGRSTANQDGFADLDTGALSVIVDSIQVCS